MSKHTDLYSASYSCFCCFCRTPFTHRVGGNRKTPILSRNVGQKSEETVFVIANCRPTGDKWQSKTLFLSIFRPRSSIVDYVFDCRLPGVFQGNGIIAPSYPNHFFLPYFAEKTCFVALIGSISQRRFL